MSTRLVVQFVGFDWLSLAAEAMSLDVVVQMSALLADSDISVLAAETMWLDLSAQLAVRLCARLAESWSSLPESPCLLR